MITGGCFCGAVKFEIEGALCKARACHCSKCRKVFSGAGSTYAEVSDTATFRWLSGEENLTKFSSVDNWAVGFCSTCGTTLCGLFNDSVHGVTLGVVDGDPGVEIDVHYYVGSKAPWDHIGGTAPQLEEGPPSNK